MAADNQPLSPNKQALLKIRQLKQQLAEAEQGSGEPIAIVSMACRFPRRSRTPEEFWKCLIEQTDETGEIPEDRWDLEAFYDEDPETPGKMYARRGVFLDQIDQMDPEFFGISPREATWVDPQQRLLMEVGWEALERAGWLADKIGDRGGVFIGWMHNDYQNEASDSFLNLNPYIATGAAGSFLCGRLAYYLGLQGPSIAVDTACSSSLVALHLAVLSLQRGDCDFALAGGVNAICSPTTNILTCKLKALSPNGWSRAFDAAADGYLRGEGCGVVALRRLSDAERNDDPILGIIRGSAVGHNGFSSGLTAPNPKAQEKVIREALRLAKVEPRDVAYLEAHGTGTELGDPIEMQAAAAALGADRDKDQPLLVGSVKTNIGHLEAAAGMAGLIKVLLAMQHDRIPGQLNFETPNPHIPWEQIPVRVLTDATEWPDAERRLAGVSAFGMSGTNAHIVLESPQSNGESKGLSTTRPQRISAEGNSEPSRLLVLSGKTSEAVESAAENLAKHLRDKPELDLTDVAFTAACRRSHFEHRAAMVADNAAEAVQTLEAIAHGESTPKTRSGHGRRAPRVTWQFTGQGSQYVGMGRQLMDAQPVFRDAIEQCDAWLNEHRGQSLKDMMFGDGDEIHNTYWTQPAIFAVQMGLAKLLESWGLRPDMVLGHSVGQYAAACVAGMMNWQDGLRLISERGRLIGELPAGGKMLAVFAKADDAEAIVAQHKGVSMAAYNGAHLVLSGPSESINAVQTQLGQRGVRCKELTTSHAFHSDLMQPALEPFREVADSVTFQPPQLPLVCNVSGQVMPADATVDGAYWARHIREPVRYAESVEAVQEAGCELMLELGPQAILTRMAAANWTGAPEHLLSCLQKNEDDADSLMLAVAHLYSQGAAIDFDAMFSGSGAQRVDLPTYPFQRRRFWGPDKPRAFHAEFHTAHPLLGGKVALAGVENETRYETFLETDSPPWLPDHEVMGHVVLPGAAFMEMSLAVAGAEPISELQFEQPLRLNTRTALQTVVSKQGDERAIAAYSGVGETWTRHFTAKLGAEASPQPKPLDLAKLEASCGETAAPADFYQKMADIGLNYGPKFQTIESLRYSETEVLAELRVQGDIRGFTLPPTLLDGALHAMAVGLLREDDGNLFLPVGVGRLQCFQPVESHCYCYAQWKQNTGDTRTADLTLLDENGVVVAVIEELRVQRINRAVLRQMSGAGSERLLFDLKWEDFRLPTSQVENTHWLLVESGEREDPLASLLSKQLSERGHQVTRVQLTAGAEAAQRSERSDRDEPFQLDGVDASQWTRFLATSDPEGAFPFAGVAWLFGNEDNQQLGESSRLLAFVHALQHAGIRAIDCGLSLITRDALAAEEERTTEPRQTRFWGLGRVLSAEQPEFRCRLIDLAAEQLADDATTETLTDILLTESRDNQLVVREGRILAPRMKRANVRKRGVSFSANPEKAYLITGGLGMLGRQAAKWLGDAGAGQVVLVSRRAADEATQAFLQEIESQGCRVEVHSADMGQRDDVAALMKRFGDELLPLGGVIHAAGVLDDALIADQTPERFAKVIAPKAGGAELLHEFTESLPLDFFILYSSAASVLGSPGQSNYATANAYLDGLAWRRRAAGLPATCLNWGPWTEGMANDERILKRLALQGITPLTVSEAHDAMERMLDADLVQATVLDVDWRRMRSGLGGEAPPMLEPLMPSKQASRMGDSELVAQLKRLSGAAQKELLVKTVQDSLQGILSTPDAPEIDRPLIEMGLDSLMAVEFGTELQQMLGDQFAITPTMLFDHPTIDAIADHVLELIVSEAGDTPAEEAKPQGPQPEDAAPARVKEPIAIVGVSCRFPGAENVDQFWDNLLNGVDSVSEAPNDRWDVERFYSQQPQDGKMYTKEGGFLDDVACFDADFFNISPLEACWTDPQHRLLLENTYYALEDAGISPHPLADANVGVFMGMMAQDYAFLQSWEDENIIKAFQGAGLSHSAGVGRISYVFGFEGPSVAVDTASSSSLVALCQAMRSLQDGHCNMAVAGGVNAILAPGNSLLMSKAGLLSPDGRCKSFSAAADGFGRGEGCGVVVLKRLSDAQRDGDRILAVVRGGSVVHNGFSGGITSPSGKSQSRAIREALRDAEVAPSQVQYLEAHGTGTEFGDPMELGAAASVYGQGRKPDNPLLVGSVKANISHLEAAGGVSGLIKTVLALHHEVLPPQVHFEEPSPHIPWQRMPLKVVTEKTEWKGPDRYAGVTALGLVGTNAHVILSAAPPAEAADGKDAPTAAKKVASSNGSQPTADSALKSDPANSAAERPQQLLVLSARSPQALDQLASSYANFLASQPADAFSNICHTAATGRRHYEHRLAVVADSPGDAINRLRQAVGDAQTANRSSNGDGSHSADPNVARAESASPPRVAWLFPEQATAELSRYARELLKTEPAFADSMRTLDERLQQYAADRQQTVIPLLDRLLTANNGNGSSAATNDELLLYAVQFSLAQMWQAWGVEPDAVSGLGVGQYAAAAVAGSLCGVEAIQLVAERQLVVAAAAKHHAWPLQDLERVELHSDVVAALDRFEQLADDLTYYPPNLRLVCGVSGEVVPVHRSLGGSFWRDHCLAATKPDESLANLQSDCDLLLRITPSDEIQGLSSTPSLDVLRSDYGAGRSVLQSLAVLYAGGVTPDFAAMDRPWARRRVAIPHYPFQRKRYWITEVAEHLQAIESMGSTKT